MKNFNGNKLNFIKYFMKVSIFMLYVYIPINFV